MVRVQFQYVAAACSCLILLAACCVEGRFPWLQETAPAAPGTYDYIIVGGGTAGCAIATTLSANSTVLLLERGGSPYGNLNLTRREGFQNNFYDIGANTPLQAFISTDGIASLRARVLGGGTSVNAGIYSRASAFDIARMGLDPVLVESAFQWVESSLPSLLPPETYQAVLQNSMLEAGLSPDNGLTYQHLVGTKITGTLFDSQGYRHPSSDLLKLANVKNIQVLLHATVHRVLFRGTRATGVMYTDSSGHNHTACLNDKEDSEVILSAGALGSPQLLMLSGVGPKQHLQTMGISVVLDSPNVGEELADNPAVQIHVPSPILIGVSREQAIGITHNGIYVTGGSRAAGGALVSEIAEPASKGKLLLKSINISEDADVNFNHFKEPADLEKCVAGLNTLEEILLSDSLQDYRFDNQTLPSGGTVAAPNRKSATSNSTLAKFCKEHGETSYHFHGGCLVGKVVDSSYRVLGIKCLRVVDGSTLEFSPGTNPCATVLMLGRYMGLQILAERLDTNSNSKHFPK